MIEITIKSLSVRVSGDEPKQLLEDAEFFQNLPSACPVCKAGVRLFFRRIKSKQTKTFGQEFSYYGICCVGAPCHESTFGVHQDKEQTLFYKESEGWTVRPQRNDESDPSPYEEPRRPGPGSPPPVASQPVQPGAPERPPVYTCGECLNSINKAAAEASWKAYGRQLCPPCMAKAAERRKTGEPAN